MSRSKDLWERWLAATVRKRRGCSLSKKHLKIYVAVFLLMVSMPVVLRSFFPLSKAQYGTTGLRLVYSVTSLLFTHVAQCPMH